MTDENKTVGDDYFTLDGCMRDGEAFVRCEQSEVDYDDIEQAIKLSEEICDEELRGAGDSDFRGACTKMHVEVGDADEAGIKEIIRRAKEICTEFDGMPICEYVPIRGGVPIGGACKCKEMPRIATGEELEHWQYTLGVDEPEEGSVSGDELSDMVEIRERFPVELWPNGVWPVDSVICGIDKYTGKPFSSKRESMNCPDDRIGLVQVESIKLDMVAPVPEISVSGIARYSRSQRRDFVEAAIEPMRREGIKYLYCLNARYKDGKLCVWARGAK